MLRDRYLVANVGFSALYNPFAQWIMVLFTLHGIRKLGLDAGQIGLGRVNATMRTATYGTIALGALAGGLAGEWLGTRAALGLGAGLCLVTIVWVALSPLARSHRSHRRPRPVR